MDAAIEDFYGKQLPERVRERILDKYCGEQNVGTSFIIETKGEQYRNLVKIITNE